ncbi:phospholipase D-like domain-containing protein [Bacillus sp. 165]|uniref:phospholipase D-like domain-containing protein n=1 Tax=Bacillus sp. 165 TaxID=1529117 RepID=UPI001FFE22F9|nr:phospholipase D-like domain-containing protein [Bacillus sp. 165]
MRKLGKFVRNLFFIIIGICLLLLAWNQIDRIAAEKRGIFEEKPIEYPLRKSDLSLYTDGKALYKQLFDDIKQAKSYIHIYFFSIADDKISHQFLDLLKEKSSQGVEVYYAVDRLGGILLKQKERKSLEQEGVHFMYYNKPKFPYLFSSLNHRNHRRNTVIDGEIGYIGGFNIGKKYLGEKEKLGHWRDYQLRISGEGVQDLEALFESDWKDNTGETISKAEVTNKQGTSAHQLIAYKGDGIVQSYEKMFQQAQTSITILTPYFIPKDERVWKSLRDARKRGVQIKILWSPHSDALLVKQAAYPYIRKALSEGIEVYGYKKGVLHGKVFMIDEKVLMVGTVNFDARSFHSSDEMNCYIYDAEYIRKVQPYIQRDLQNAKRINSSYVSHLSLKEKAKEWLAKMIASYL